MIGLTSGSSQVPSKHVSETRPHRIRIPHSQDHQGLASFAVSGVVRAYTYIEPWFARGFWITRITSYKDQRTTLLPVTRIRRDVIVSCLYIYRSTSSHLYISGYRINDLPMRYPLHTYYKHSAEMSFSYTTLQQHSHSTESLDVKACQSATRYTHLDGKS